MITEEIKFSLSCSDWVGYEVTLESLVIPYNSYYEYHQCHIGVQ